jgi:hypothetical protein
VLNEWLSLWHLHTKKPIVGHGPSFAILEERKSILYSGIQRNYKLDFSLEPPKTL